MTTQATQEAVGLNKIIELIIPQLKNPMMVIPIKETLKSFLVKELSAAVKGERARNIRIIKKYIGKISEVDRLNLILEITYPTQKGKDDPR